MPLVRHVEFHREKQKIDIPEEFQVVIANGSMVTANAVENPDCKQTFPCVTTWFDP